MPEKNKEFPYGLNYDQKPYRLFCFHHAGGSVSIFKDWLKFSPIVEVIPVEIPGHSTRMDEECITDFDRVVEESAKAIKRVNDNRPIYIYGHSLGAIIAFQVVYFLQNIYNIETKKLFVAGVQAPADKSTSEYKSYMEVEKLHKELLKMGMTTKEEIENETFQEVFQPIIINDYRLRESYMYRGEKINSPIVALCGDKDIEASCKVMSKWKAFTDGGFREYEFSGNHFFPYEENENQVLNAIQQEILP